MKVNSSGLLENKVKQKGHILAMTIRVIMARIRAKAVLIK